MNTTENLPDEQEDKEEETPMITFSGGITLRVPGAGM